MKFDKLGQPDLQIAGLRLWVHGRQFEDAADYWDGNWLRVTAHCVYPGSSVSTDGSIVRLNELAILMQGCEQIYASLKGQAKLSCIEPNLNVELTAETLGRIKVEMSITPDHMSQTHRYVDGFDQSFLPPIISACRLIIEKFPIRGSAEPTA